MTGHFGFDMSSCSPFFAHPSRGRTANSSLITLLAAMLFVAGSKTDLRAEDAVNPLTDTELVQFLGQWCLDCHGPDTQESGLRFDTLSQRWDDPGVAAQWRGIQEQVLFRAMPPEGSDAADAVERDRFVKELSNN